MTRLPNGGAGGGMGGGTGGGTGGGPGGGTGGGTGGGLGGCSDIFGDTAIDIAAPYGGGATDCATCGTL